MPGPALVIPSGFGLATLLLKVVGRTKLYTTAFGYDCGGFETSDNTAALETAAISTGSLFAHANMGTQYSWEGVRTRQNLSGTEYVFDLLHHVQGTAALNSPPPNVCELVRKHSGLAGKKNRGRLYLPPLNVTEADLDQNGVINSTAVSFIQGYATTFLGNLTAATFPMVILHHGAGAPTLVDSLVVEPLVATQRRRLR